MAVAKNYLEKSRRHICIVGKFFVSRDQESRIIDNLTFADAADKFRFPLYSYEKEIELDSMALKLPGFKLPREVDNSDNFNELRFPRIFDEFSDDAKNEFDGSPDSRDNRAEFIGGQLFIELLNALDDALPFSHPNFDKLISAAFIDYIEWKQRTGDKNTLILEMSLADFVEHPVVNQRIVSFIRNAPEEVEVRKGFLITFKRAAREAEKQIGGFDFGSLDAKPDNGDDSYLDILSGYLDEFQRWLNDCNTRPYIPHSDLFLSGVSSWTIPSHAQADEYEAGPIEYVRDLFRKFYDANTRIQEILECGPLLSLIGYWALRRFGSNSDAMARTMGKKYYSISNPRARESNFFSDADAESLSRDVEQDLSIKTRRDKDKVAEQAVADAIARRAMQVVRNKIQWKSKYGAEDLFKLLNELHVRLMALLTKGLKEKLAEADALAEKFCEAFMIYQKEVRSNKDLNSSNLKSKLEEALGKDTYRQSSSWLDELCEEAAKEDLQVEEIAEQFRNKFRERITEELSLLSNQFIDQQSEEIDRASKDAEVAHKSVLQALRPNSEGVPEAAPGGSLGVYDLEQSREEKKGKGALEEYREIEASRRSLARTAELANVLIEKLDSEQKELSKVNEFQTASEGPENVSKNADWKQSLSEALSVGRDSEDSDEYSIHLTKLEETLETVPENQWDTGEMGPLPSEYAEQHWDMQDGMSRLLNENDTNLILDTTFAGERGIFRALLAGKYLYALPEGKSLLSLEDRSLVVQLLVRMLQFVGASAEWESPNIIQGASGTRARRKKLARTKEVIGEEGNSQHRKNAEVNTPSGVEKVPWKDIFPVPPNSGRDGIQKLTRCLEGCVQTARAMVRAADELEEREGLLKLLKALRDSGKEGWVTIVNETLEEHQILPSSKQRILAVPVNADFEPPSVCYITRQAASSNSMKTNIEPLLESLFDDVHEDEPEEKQRPLGERKHYRYLKNKSVKLGMPVLVGPGLVQEASENSYRKLPVLAIDGPDTWQAVMCLSGLSSDSGKIRIWNEPISESRQAKFHERALAFKSKMASKISGQRPLGAAWCDVLVGNEALAQQFWSRVASWALSARINDEKKADNIHMGKAVNAALVDLAKTYGLWYEDYPGKRRQDTKDSLVGKFLPRFHIDSENADTDPFEIPLSDSAWNQINPSKMFVGSPLEDKKRRIPIGGLHELFARI